MCYLGPASAALISTLIWRKNKSVKLFYLMLMFYGSAIFGLVDHLLNGELFLVTDSWPKDLLLGLIIVLITILFWRSIIYFLKRSALIVSDSGKI